MAYAASDLKADLDQIAKIESLLVTALGDGSGASSISARAKAIRTRVLAAQDANVSLKFLNGVHQFYQAALATPEDTTAGVPASTGVLTAYFWNALRSMYGDIVAALNDLDVRMHPLAAANYQKSNQAWPNASLVYPYATKLGTVVRGASVFTFTDDDDIDHTLYAPSQLVVTPVGTIGAASITAILTLVPAYGSDETQVAVTIPNGSTAPISVGSGRYIDLVDVECTGGTNSDSFTIDSVLERALPS